MRKNLRRMVDATTLPVQASGGVGTLEHLSTLASTGAAACVVGRALYEGAFSVAEGVRVAGKQTI